MCRLGYAGESEVVRSVCGEPFKNVVLRSPIQKRRIGNADVVPASGLGGLYYDQAARIVKWKWPQQDRVNHAEDGRVGPDAQRERQHRNGCKRGALAQLTQRVA